MTQAAQAIAIETGALVAQQLQPTGQDLVEPAKRAGRRLPPRVAPTRVTRGERAKAEAVSRLEAEAKLELDAREDELAQEAQETGPEGSRILGEPYGEQKSRSGVGTSWQRWRNGIRVNWSKGGRPMAAGTPLERRKRKSPKGLVVMARDGLGGRR